MNMIDRIRSRRASARRARAIALAMQAAPTRSMRDELIAISSRY